MHRVSSPPAWPSAMSPACPEISRLISECPALSLMPSNGPQEPRKTKSRSTCIRPVIASQDRPTASILWTPFPPCIQVLHLRCTFPYHSPQPDFLFRQVLRLLPAAQAVLWPLTTTFLTLSWAWLFLRPTLPFWPPPLSSGTPLAFLCPRLCGQSAMQAAPAIAVQVFALAGRPGPCPGTSCRPGKVRGGGSGASSSSRSASRLMLAHNSAMPFSPFEDRTGIPCIFPFCRQRC